MTATTSDVTSRPLALALALGVAMAVSTVAGTLVGVLAPYLQEEVGLTASQIGILVAVFAFTSGTFSWPAGLVTDAIGGRRTLLLVFSGSVAAMLMLASAFSYVWLLAAMLVAGIGNSAVNPATNRTIADSVAPGRQGMAAGVKMACVQLGIFAAGILIPVAAEGAGWRIPFAATIVVVSVLGVVGLLALTSPGGRPRGQTGRRSPMRWSRPLLTLAAYSLLMSAGASAVVTYLPLYSIEALGSTARVGGLAVASMGLLAIVGRLGLGRATERLASPTRSLVVVGFLGAISIGVIIAVSSTSGILFWLGVVGLGLSAQSFVAGTTVAVIVSMPRDQVGGATGVVFLGFLMGWGAGPAVFGATVDATGGFTVGWTATLALFALATLLVAVPSLPRRGTSDQVRAA